MKLELLKSAQKELDKLPDHIVLQISNKIFKLASDPYIQGSTKLGGGKGYRIRVGNYRVIYQVNKKVKTVFITKIRHRREAYK